MDEQAKEKIKKRIKLRTSKIRQHKKKEEEEQFQQTVKKVAKKECIIWDNDPENFPLLKENRTPDETFSRVCRYTINHYYTNENGECIMEHLFYPSQFGVLEIEIMQESEQGHPYEEMYRILREKGIGRFDYSDDDRLTKKPKRKKLQIRPERMRLQCKE